MKQINKFFNNINEEFEKNFSLYGDNTKTVNMHIVNQYAGFISLTNDIDMDNGSILDIGCGLGDINDFFKYIGTKNYNYLGIDIVESFIKHAQEKYIEDFIKFKQGNFIDDSFDNGFDYIMGNKIFYRKINGIDTFEYIKEVIVKAFNLCNKGVMFNFLSDKAEIKYEKNYYMSPSTILDLSFELSRNVILRNDYSPFEFSIIIFKENDIHIRPTYFIEFAKKHENILKKVYPNIENELK